MAISLRYFVLGCCVFLAFQQVVDCLTCYSCTACGDNQNSWGTASSVGSSVACFKYVYKDKPISYSNRGVQGSCSPNTDGSGGTTYCCSTDYCNGSVSLSSSLGLVFALIAAVCGFKTVMAN